MKRRCLAWVVVSAVLLLIVAVGWTASATESAPVEIRFRYFAWPAHAKVAKQWVDLFNAKFMPHIKLVWDGFAGTTDDERAKYMTMLMAGASDIDIMLCDSPWVAEFAAKGWLLPLDQFMEDKEAFLAPFYEFSKSIGSHNGTQVGLPVSLDCSFLYYRTDVFNEKAVEPPATLEELVDVAQQVNNPPDLYGLLFQGAQYEGLVCFWIELLHNLGGTIFGESQSNSAGGIVGQRVCQLESEAAAKATQLLYDLIYSYHVSPPGTTTYTEAEVRKFFEAGGGAMAREWMDMIAEFNNPLYSQVAGNVGVIPLPAGPAGSHSCIGGWVFAINAFTKHPEEAWIALNFLTSIEALKVELLTAGMTPPRSDVYADSEVANHPIWGQYTDLLVQVAESGIPRPLSPLWPQQSDVIQRAIHKVFLGEMTAEEAMYWADREIQKIEDEYKGY